MKTQLIKLLVFVALLGTFYAFDGFERPVVAQEDYRGPRGSHGLARAWLATVLLFVSGSVLAVWGNAIADRVDWDLPEGVYPVIGGLLLVAGFVWMWMVRGSVSP